MMLWQKFLITKFLNFEWTLGKIWNFYTKHGKSIFRTKMFITSCIWIKIWFWHVKGTFYLFNNSYKNLYKILNSTVKNSLKPPSLLLLIADIEW